MPSASGPSNAARTAATTARTASAGWAATVAARSRAAPSVSAAGTTRVTKPRRSASAAPTRRPVSTSSIARALPTARARRWVPPAPGMIPRLISGWPKVASSAATSMSQAMASSAPPPSAKPRTAAIVGVATAATRSQPRSPGEAARLAGVCAASSATSAPAAKARVPAPVITIAPQDGSASSSSTTSARRSRSAKLRALRARGRFSVTRATPPTSSGGSTGDPSGPRRRAGCSTRTRSGASLRVTWSATAHPSPARRERPRRRPPVSTPRKACGRGRVRPAGAAPYPGCGLCTAPDPCPRP